MLYHNIYNEISLSNIFLKKGQDNAIYKNMNGPKDCHTASNESKRGEILHDVPYLPNLKNYTNELIYKTEADSQI